MASPSPDRGKVKKLYIGGLLDSVTKDDLMHELTKYGDVADVWIARNPPGFAFAQYVKNSDAEKAVRALDGVNLCGSRVRVEFARFSRSRKGSSFRGSRSAGRGPPRRYDSPRRNGRYSPPYDSSRYSYDQLASFYHPDIANAAAVAAGFPYGMGGYPPVLPFLPPEDLLRGFQHSRRRSPYARGRSPVPRRRSRSPLGPGGGRPRARSPPITYDGREPLRRSDYRGSFGEPPRGPRNGYQSPPMMPIDGRRDDRRRR